MKKVYILIVILGFAQITLAQNTIYNTLDEKTRSWDDDDTWTTTNPGKTGIKKSTLNIKGYITSSSTLEFDNNSGLTIESGDTLVVLGDLIFKNNATLSINTGAVLLVSGSLISDNNIDVENGGKVVVGGDLSVGKGTSEINTAEGAFYVVGMVDADAETALASGAIEGEDALHTNDGDLANFFNQVAPGVLPVNLLYFSATPQQNAVKLDWASSKAWDFSHYELERSADGITFNYLATIDAEENSNWTVNYSFTDDQPLNGNSYYRLKAVDIDGVFEYKGIEVVQFAARASLKAYPNPATNGILHVQQNDKAAARVSLKDNSGRTVYTGTMLAAAKTIDTSSLPSGLYVLIVEGATGVQKKHIIIQ